MCINNLNIYGCLGKQHKINVVCGRETNQFTDKQMLI